MKTLMMILIAAATASAQANDLSILVLDGAPVSSGSDVSKALVQLDLEGALCSGVAISPRHVLTAGHCVVKKPAASRIRVSLGAGLKAGPRVKSYRLHPDYGWVGNRVRADLAILRLESAFPSTVVPAPITAAEPASGLPLIMAGYGYSNREQTRIGRLLQTTFTFGSSASFIDSFPDGTRRIGYFGPVNLCQGDSGGPTLRRTSAGLRTVGIHSMADCDSRGLDTFVLDHAAWIQSMLAL